MNVKAYAIQEPNAILRPYSYTLGAIGPEQVDIQVMYCGLCLSDVSMINNDWGSTQYPLVPGHEVVGRVVHAGTSVKQVKVGDLVGMGWISSSCMSCQQCMTGEHHLCHQSEATIVGRHGGFANYIRGHWSWTIPLPDGIDLSKAGPLFCGGITVFSPIVKYDVRPTDVVGVIGIGGLGHLALKFLKYWGCEVIAFSSNPAKKQQILSMGASRVIDSRDRTDLKSARGKIDFLMNTTNISLDWNSYLRTLTPKGRLHTVGTVLKPMAIPAFSLIAGEKSVSGSRVP